MPAEHDTPYAVRVTSEPGLPPVHVPMNARQAAAVVDAALRSGRITEHRASWWLSRVMAGGAEGAEAVATLVELAPIGRVAASGPVLPSDPDEATYAALYGQVAAAGAAADGQPAPAPAHHGAMSTVHEHMHRDHAGGAHSHPHVHRGDGRHSPGAGHPHIAPVAAAAPLEDPVLAGIAARRAADPHGPAGLTDDEVYRALYGGG